MRCYRCGGAMNYERFDAGGESFYGRRCIACGEIVDEVILKNRENSGKTAVQIQRDGRTKGSPAVLQKTQTVEQRNEMYRLLGIKVPRGSVPMPVPRRPPEKKMDWLPSDKLIDAPFDPSSRRG